MPEAVASPVSIDIDLCSGCGQCLNSCPTDVFGFDKSSGKAFLAYPSDCSVCFLCVGDCPTGALKVDYAITGARKHSAYADYDPEALVFNPSELEVECHD